jgi:hypothetical protein
MVRGYLRTISSAVLGLNEQDWWTMGKRVSGGDLYANIYKQRCVALYGAMLDATFVLK